MRAYLDTEPVGDGVGEEDLARAAVGAAYSVTTPCGGSSDLSRPIGVQHGGGHMVPLGSCAGEAPAATWEEN